MPEFAQYEERPDASPEVDLEDEPDAGPIRIPKWVWLVCIALAVPSLFGFGGRWAHQLKTLPEPRHPTGNLTAWSSAAFSQIPVAHEQCYLANNRWNTLGNADSMEQETFVVDDSGQESFGWRWRSPWLLFSKIVAYPEVVCGAKPWDTPMGRIDGFPFHPAPNSPRLTADFHSELEAVGTYNLAFSLWAVSQLPATPQNIQTEVMIWTAQAGQRPSGKPLGVITVNGVRWEVWVNDRQRDAAGTNSSEWTYVAYVAQTPVTGGPLSISAFLDDAVDRHLMTPDAYVTDLEFGDEVSEGSGFAQIRGFRLHFDPQEATSTAFQP